MLRGIACLLALGFSLTAAKKVNPKDGLTYIWIAPGTFAMGCSAGDRECFDWEPAPHKVTIARGFWIGRTEVTQAAYQRVIGTNPSLYKGANLPVEQVGWNDARAYCQAVGMRLPTEAEWEYAARGGSPAPQYGAIASIAWFDPNSEDKTHPVATKAPNGYGLYDTLGNVWEWVEDSYNEERKLLRGGAFINLSRDLRVSNKLWATPDTRHRDIGIRCAANRDR
jgi:formylglycine-generating enzyme required for sulfatase activity